MGDAVNVVRDAADVTVRRAVVHVLDHRSQTLTLSDAELSFDGNQPLRDYFSEQIRKALNDAQTGAARFSTDGEQAATQQCRRILSEGKHLVASSKTLATLLYTAMGKDERIAPGTLAVCLFTASNYPKKTFLALIKLDPMRAFVQEVKPRNGGQVISYEEYRNVMPTRGEKLHKAAIIPPDGVTNAFDLLLLDRQVSKVAANFFAYTFLNTFDVLAPKEATEKLFDAARNAYNRLISPQHPARIDPEEGYALQQQIQAALLSPVVDLADWVAKLSLKDAARAVVAEEIRLRLPGEGQVLVDPKHARDELFNKKRFRGEDGVMFEVDFKQYDEVVKEFISETRPDGKVVTTLKMKVVGLQWVRR